MSRNEAVSLIQKYIEVLKQAGMSISKAFLYGSYAHDTATEDSDIDVLLISEQFDTSDDAVRAKPWLYTVGVDPRIEPYSVGLDRFEHDHASLILEIVRREGIEIPI